MRKRNINKENTRIKVIENWRLDVNKIRSSKVVSRELKTYIVNKIVKVILTHAWVLNDVNTNTKSRLEIDKLRKNLKK